MSAAPVPGQQLPAPLAGAACLDLANTVGPRRPDPGVVVHDYLAGYGDLLTWAARAGLLTPGQRRHLTAAAEADPDGAAAVLEDVRRLREAIYLTFADIARGAPAPAAALATLRAGYLAALGAGRLDAAADGVDWCWPDRGPLEQVSWPIARSAVELVLSDRLTRVKQCPGDDGRCGWLFVDTTKNATRRWCSMRTCGSRLKSRRQAARRRSAPGQA